MDDLITQLGHWFGEVYGSGRHKTTLALQLVGVAMVITGALEARDYAKRSKRLKEDQAKTLENASLSMTLLSDENGTPVKYVATVTGGDARYQLNIMKTTGAAHETTASEHFQSLADVEAYLKQNTQFLLTDFK
ncbi:hypothetical protein [Pseudomonas sp. NPDC086278]|uniref:hypothetical protein n=1 Tax=Pseudomonas sp. NPDC086278 TaxID=3390646 RepID=UPI003D01159D